MTIEEEQILRNEIADYIDEKMAYFGSCPNERDSIVDIIRGKRVNRENHCNTDCWVTDCKSYHYDVR